MLAKVPVIRCDANGCKSWFLVRSDGTMPDGWVMELCPAPGPRHWCVKHAEHGRALAEEYAA